MNGNFGIGKAADMNARLDVSGSAIITGSLTMSSAGAYSIYANGSYGVLMMYAGTNYGTIAGTNSGMSVNSTQATDLNLGTAGSANITIKYGGNVGIGKSTPNAVLDVNGNTIITGSLAVTGSLLVTNGSGNAGISINCGTTSNYGTINFNQASTGKWAAGVEATTSNFYISNTPGFGGVGYILYLDRTNSRAAINKTTAPNATLDVSGSAIISGSLAVTGDITAIGNVTAYFSDDRLKNNLGNIPDSLNKVLSLNGFYFEPNQTAIDFGYTKQKEVGVSAQQVQAILPEIIVAAPIDPIYMTVRYEKLIPLLIEAIKEQNSMIVNLQQKINRL